VVKATVKTAAAKELEFLERVLRSANGQKDSKGLLSFQGRSLAID
jgi:hypothetical protein